MKDLTIRELADVQDRFDAINFHANEPRLLHAGRHLGKVIGRYASLAENRAHRPNVSNPAIIFDEVVPNLAFSGAQYLAESGLPDSIVIDTDGARYDQTLAELELDERMRLEAGTRAMLHAPDSDQKLRVISGELTWSIIELQRRKNAEDNQALIARRACQLIRLSARILAEEGGSGLQELYEQKLLRDAERNGTLYETKEALGL